MYRTHKLDGQQGPSLLEIALMYYRRGWSIIPIQLGTKKPPRGLRWKRYQSERPDEARLKRWFGNRGDRGLAVIHGEVSGGLVCRDFDSVESCERWAREHPGLAKSLPTVATAKGQRVYFLGAEQYAKLPDGELIGDSGHYSVLPPSRHADGPFYRWLIPLLERLGRLADEARQSTARAVAAYRPKVQSQLDDLDNGGDKMDVYIVDRNGSQKTNLTGDVDANAIPTAWR